MSDETKTEAGKLELKDTVNLPKTDFPMKGNLAQLEPRMLGWWEEHGIYAKLLEKNALGPRFVMHDGPPYANGHLHAGHALNKILKDIVVKYRNMSGALCDFVPGWDCHGLPIEQAVEKRLKEKKIDRRTLPRDEFLDKCRAYAEEFISIQREEFKRMGVMARWDQPYKTLTTDFEAQEIRELAKFARQQMVYRRKKPVYWCLTDHTALAEAEVEYDEHTSPSVYVPFEAVTDLSQVSSALAGKKVAFVIWTTTPWTLPANLAIAVHPEFEYVFYQLGERVLVVAKDLLVRVLTEIAPAELAAQQVDLKGLTFDATALVDPSRILAYARGEELRGTQYKHVFYDRVSPVLTGEHVTLEQGTGLVHTAPGHGQEDYELGLANGLEIYNPIRHDGRYDDTVGPELAGKKLFEANPLIVERLFAQGSLLNDKNAKVSHSYPHCWRCRNPVVFLATNQWFIALDKTGLRKQALEEIDRVNWVPKWGRERIHGMLEGRPDWCISRQRTWGVPIPVVLCNGCDHAHVSAELMEKVADRVETEGTGVWYRTPVEEFLPAGFKCPGCGGADLRRETDILDVWFDSACTFAAVAKKRDTLGFPADLYLEGSDQHRGWFHSSLLVAVGTEGKAPYKTCLTHGFVVDGEGRKMSKSVGNVVVPEKIITQYGAEVMRLWVASSDYRDDVRLSDQILKGLSEGYRKIRNTIRYALSNLHDFNPETDRVSNEGLLPLDRWAQSRLTELTAKVRKAYEAYEFHMVFHLAVEFCAMDLSAVYFDILKDRLYTWKRDGQPRRAAQTVLYDTVKDLLRLLAPVMSFTTEEAWQLLPGQRTESVLLGGMPQPAPVTDAAADAALRERYLKLFAVRAEVQKLLEAARRDKLIGASLEAKVVLFAESPEARKFLEANLAELPSLLIVSQVELRDQASAKAFTLSLASALPGTVRVEVLSADGEKCPRCWAYSDAVGKGSELCLKCRDALAV
ncbi:MAG: isoleucine--tRNA ligase [Myxococcota bacterium]|nr:isoleucine--tRNA ligase [Myxococcota bacterium]